MLIWILLGIGGLGGLGYLVFRIGGFDALSFLAEGLGEIDEGLGDCLDCLGDIDIGGD